MPADSRSIAARSRSRMPRRYGGSEAALPPRPSARPCPRDAAARAGGRGDADGGHRRRPPAALPRRHTCRRPGWDSRSPRNARATDGSGRCAATAPAAPRACRRGRRMRKWVSAFWPSSGSTCISLAVARARPLGERQVDGAFGLGRHADHDRPVELLGLAVAERLAPAAWPPARCARSAARPTCPCPGDGPAAAAPRSRSAARPACRRRGARCRCRPARPARAAC